MADNPSSVFTEIDPDTWVSAHQQHYAEMMAQMREWDALYEHELTTTLALPEGVRMHESASPSLVVDNLRDQIRIDEPLVSFRARGPSKEAREHQEQMEMWGRFVMARIAETHLLNPYQQAPHDLLLRGAACWKYLPLIGVPPRLGESQTEYEKAVAEFEEGEAESFPFYVTAVDPLLLYPSPGSQSLRYMVEVQERRLIDMEEYRRKGLWSDPLRSKVRRGEKDNPLRTVKWVEIWTPERYVVKVDGEVVRDMPNPNGGVIPYIYRYSGLGRAHADGNPKHLAVGVLASIQGELEAEIEIMTALRADYQYHVFPALLTTEDERETARKFQKGPGSVIRHKPGEPPTWLQRPPLNTEALTLLDRVRQSINRKVSPALNESAADYGVHQALLIGQALKTISAVKSAFNSMGTELLNGLARYMHWFDVNMNVYGTSEEVEKPRRVRGRRDFTLRNFDVTFEVVDPAENERKMLAALSVKREPGLISRETYRKKYLPQIESNTEEEAKILAEQTLDQLVASGWLASFVVSEIMARRGVTQPAPVTAGVEATAGAVGQEIAGRERGLEALTGAGQIPLQQMAAQGGGAGVGTPVGRPM